MTKTTPPGIALDNEALDKLEALARAATPGPWRACVGTGATEVRGEPAGDQSNPRVCRVLRADPLEHSNAAFIAAANPATLTALVAQARAVQPQPSAAPDEWMPIEAAPMGAKGYAWMMLKWGNPEDPNTGAGMRCGDRFFASATFYCLGQAKQYEFREIEVNPTHWMPMPDTSKDNKTTSPNFAARGAEPVGMQAAGQSIDTPEFRNLLADMIGAYRDELRGGYDLPYEKYRVKFIAHIDAQLSAARQGHVDAVSTSGERVEKAPGNERIEAARQGQGDPVARVTRVFRSGGSMAAEIMGFQDGQLIANAPLYAAPQPTAAPTPQALPAGAQEDERALFEAAEIAYWQSRQPAHAGPLTAEEKAYLLRPNVWDKTSYEACDGRWEGWQWSAQIDRKGAVQAPTPHEQEARAVVPNNAAVVAIQIALANECGDGLQFLRYWNEGEFDKIRRNWTNVPDAVFIGADPLYPITQAGMLPVAQTDAARPRTELDGWNAAADALTERAVAHFRNKDFKLQDECLQCASMLHDMRRAAAAKGAAGLEGGDA